MLNNSKGFTLLEVLIAISLISIVLVGFLELNVFNLYMLNRSNTLTKLLFLTKRRMSELGIARYPEIGQKTGEFTDYPGYKWIENVSNFGIDGVHKVEISVVAPDGETNKIIMYKAR